VPGGEVEPHERKDRRIFVSISRQGSQTHVFTGSSQLARFCSGEDLLDQIVAKIVTLLEPPCLRPSLPVFCDSSQNITAEAASLCVFRRSINSLLFDLPRKRAKPTPPHLVRKMGYLV
jgi:hypothetical protein